MAYNEVVILLGVNRASNDEKVHGFKAEIAGTNFGCYGQTLDEALDNLLSRTEFEIVSRLAKVIDYSQKLDPIIWRNDGLGMCENMRCTRIHARDENDVGVRCWLPRNHIGEHKYHDHGVEKPGLTNKCQCEECNSPGPGCGASQTEKDAYKGD